MPLEPTLPSNLYLVGEKNGFIVYFNTDKQEYVVFKDGKFFIGNKYKFSDVKSYLD